MSFFNLSVKMVAYSINDAGKPMTKPEIIKNCREVGQALGNGRMHIAINTLIELGALDSISKNKNGYVCYQLKPNWQEICKNLDLPVVYLAGKMDGGDVYEQTQSSNRGWRWPLIGKNLFRENEDYWTNCLIDDFFYAGLYYGKWEAHMTLQQKNSHGVGAGEDWAGGRDQYSVVQFCLDAINDCDIVFAWLNTNDAHGTLMEISWAIAKNKDVILVVPRCDCSIEFEGDVHVCVIAELWFAHVMVHKSGGTVIYSNDPIKEFYKVIARWNRTNQKFNSVPEKEFWTKVINDPDKGLLYKDIVSQHPVGKYRIDFAIPKLKFGIEIDGLAYHNGQDSFMKDRSRQREIESQGWRIVRFAAKEISLDVDKCFREAEAIAVELSRSLVGAK